jgi:hypothetical protein
MKQWWENYFRYRQNQIACAVTAFAAVVIVLVLFVSPRPVLLDQGSYDARLAEFGLSRLTDDTVQQTFAVEAAPWSSLALLHPVQSLLYPVRLVCLVCGVLGIPFSTEYLAAVLTLMWLAALYVLLKSLYPWLRGFTFAVGIGLCGIYLCGNYLAFFNSLYGSGMFLVSALAFAAALAHAMALLRDGSPRRMRILPPVFITAELLCTSVPSAALLVLPVTALCVWVTVRCAKVQRLAIRCKVCVVLSLGILLGSSAVFLKNSTAFSQVDLYHAAFDGVLQVSDEPEALLEEWGMDPALAKDVGKSYYEAKRSYVVCPYGEEAQAQIFDHLSYGVLLRTYLRHPQLAKAVLYSVFTQDGGGLSDGRVVALTAKNTTQTVTLRNDIWNQFHRLLPVSPIGWGIFLLLNFAVGIVLAVRRRRLGVPLCTLSVADGILLVLCFLRCGTVEAADNRLWFFVLFDAILLVWGVAVILAAHRVSEFLLYADFSARKRPVELYPAESYAVCLPDVLLRAARRVRQWGTDVLADEKRLTVVCTAVLAVLMVWVLFFPRIGAYNNGDFGRMMDAMQLNYTPSDYYNAAEQYGTKVVERYDYIEPYDWSTLRPSHATLSQVYISAFCRILYELTSLPFSTVTVAVLYVALLIWCYARLIHAAARHLGGRFGLAVTVGLAVIYCGSSNLGWLNSLYGEGIGFVSLLLVVASSVALLEEPQHPVRGLLRYGASAVLFAGAKAQYTLTAPLLLVWGICLLVYCLPKQRRVRIAACLVAVVLGASVAREALNVYRNNNEISSQDTLYQGLCYGILMVADDPVVALEELGLDPALAQDAGKNAYLSAEEYYCAPRTEMAEELIYSKVSSTDYLLWYLRHPKQLWMMMNAAARAAKETMPDYLLYVGEKTSEEHRTVQKFDFWASIHTLLAPSYFVGYLVFYGVILLVCAKVLLTRSIDRHTKMYLGLLVFFMFCGILQYPLTVIGNGFADNVKQLYLFRVTFDGTLLTAALAAVRFLRRRIRRIHRTERSVCA